MVQKKGQAAMEFLMTYGWALLVVLIAIGALAFFGVLNPSRFLPNSCSVAPGFACTDFAASAASGDITVVLQNGLGENLGTVRVTLTKSNVVACDGPFGHITGGGTQTVTTFADGAATTFVRDCGAAGILTAGTKFKGDLTVGYQIGSTGLAHNKVGQLVVGIEA